MMASKKSIFKKKNDGVKETSAGLGTVSSSTADKSPSLLLPTDDTLTTKNTQSNKKEIQLEEQMDHVLQLLNQRVQGDATTEQVEFAVKNILEVMGTPPSSTSTSAGTKKAMPRLQEESRIIQEDTGNYDSDDSNEDDTKPVADPDPVVALPSLCGKKRKYTEKDDQISSCYRPDVAVEKDDMSDERLLQNFDEGEYEEAIAKIPMGWEAAKMMTTFGDGPRPQPQALEAALLGTRKTLQLAIMDARIIRRRLQKEFRKAEVTVDPNAFKKQKDKKTKATKKRRQKEKDEDNTSVATITDTKPAAPAVQRKQHHHGVDAVDPNMLYRALANGLDKLSGDQKCGFHMEELTHLFPEEMRAYQRWTEMHEEYSEKKGEPEHIKEEAVNGNDEGFNDQDNDHEDRKTSSTTPPPTPQIAPVADLEPDGGHLRERAAHFDFRTDRMKEDWYLEYSKVRQGSFLPSTVRVRRTQAEKDWDELRKKKRGRRFMGSWETMSGRSVRFLHWLGFDPPNLYPPDEEVAHALAFLAYDRLGRIVEKAIYLRNLNQRHADGEKMKSEFNTGLPDEITGPLWELPGGEQLTKEDIERALEDPDVKPATVYGADDSTSRQTSIQLYFGPGWEDRLELEMEEFLAATQGEESGPQISEEERAFRQQEANLLAKISAAPSVGEDCLKRLVAEKNAEDTGKIQNVGST